MIGEPTDFSKEKWPNLSAVANVEGWSLRAQLYPCVSQSPDTEAANNGDSTNRLSPNPVNNMWDYYLFRITTICEEIMVDWT